MRQLLLTHIAQVNKKVKMRWKQKWLMEPLDLIGNWRNLKGGNIHHTNFLVRVIHSIINKKKKLLMPSENSKMHISLDAAGSLKRCASC